MHITRRRSFALLAALGVMPTTAVGQNEKEKRKPSFFRATQGRIFKVGERVVGRLTVACDSVAQGERTSFKDIHIKIELVPQLTKFSPTRITYSVIEKATPSSKLAIRKQTEVIHGLRSTLKPNEDKGMIEIRVRTKRKGLTYELVDKTNLTAHFKLVDAAGDDPFINLMTIPPQYSMHVNAGQVTREGKQILDQIGGRDLRRHYFTADRYKRDAPYFQAEPTITADNLQRTESFVLTATTDKGQKLDLAVCNVRALKTLYGLIDSLVQQNIETLKAGKGTPQYSSGCVLSTIVCQALAMPDDAWELQTLRRYRDNYLANSPLAQEVQRYYRLSHRVLDSDLLASENGQREVRRLYWSMVLPCAVMSRLGLNKTCYRLYRRQITSLVKRSRR